MKRRPTILVYLVAALLVAACASNADAQGRRGGQGGFGQGGRGGPGGFGRGGFGGGMFGGNQDLMLLRRNDVQKELELLDDQVEQLQGVTEGMNIREMWQQLQDLPREEQFTKMQEAREEMQKKIQGKVNEILLPHQVTRLKQLTVQFQMQGRGITGGPLAEQLDISEAQQAQLREKARKLEQEMRKKMQDELIKELTPAQQAKLEQLVGEPFVFEQEERQFPGPGAGGPRQRGAGGRRGRGN